MPSWGKDNISYDSILSFSKTPGSLCPPVAILAKKKKYSSDSDSPAGNKAELVTIIIIYLSHFKGILTAPQNRKEHMTRQIPHHEFSGASLSPLVSHNGEDRVA